jgi:predicted nucleic acid-binding protein
MRCQKRVVLEQQLERLVLQVPVLFPQGPEICQHYAEQATALKRAGTPIGANDLWIVCHALAEGVTSLTLGWCGKNDSVQALQNPEQPIKARVWRLSRAGVSCSSCGVWCV